MTTVIAHVADLYSEAEKAQTRGQPDAFRVRLNYIVLDDSETHDSIQVTGLSGNDTPAQMQDKIMAALRRKLSTELGHASVDRVILFGLPAIL